MNPILLLIAAALLVGMLAGTGYSILNVRELNRRMEHVERRLGLSAPPALDADRPTSAPVGARSPDPQTAGSSAGEPPAREDSLPAGSEVPPPKTKPAPGGPGLALHVPPTPAEPEDPPSLGEWEERILESLENSAGSAASELARDRGFRQRLNKTAASMESDPKNARWHFDSFVEAEIKNLPEEMRSNVETIRALNKWREEFPSSP